MSVVPALLRSAPNLPAGRGWAYEPKLDGFRGLLSPDRLISRSTKPLGDFFPELVEISRLLPPGTIVDGEIVQPNSTGISFEALQARLIREGRGAAFIAFDLLVLYGTDLRDGPLSERRRTLEALVRRLDRSELQLVPQTTDRAAALRWLTEFNGDSGVEGVVAKRLTAPYPRNGRRDWIKVKRTITFDAFVRGISGDPARPRLVLGVYDEMGLPWTLGMTHPLGSDAAAVLAPLLEAAQPAERLLPSRFQEMLVDWLRLPEVLVAEVSCHHIDGGHRLRQAAKFIRWRPDRQPTSCRQLPTL